MQSKLFNLGLLCLILYVNFKSVRSANWYPVDLEALDSSYKHSQYCVPKCEFRGNIDDPELYTLAGYRYLQGVSPSLINPELQPLTKYFFGISTHLFKTPLVAQLIFGAFSIIFITLISRYLLPRSFFLLPALFLSIDPLFQNQLTHAYLDLSLSCWSLILLYMLTKKIRRKSWVSLGIVLGAVALSKSFSFGILAALLLGFWHWRNNYMFVLKTLFIAFVVYLLAYTPLILSEGIFSLLNLHFDILRFYHSYVPEYPKGEVFRIIFTGQWRTWWDSKGLIPSPFYSWLWPVSTSIAILAIFNKKQNSNLLLHLMWITIILCFTALRLVFPRYLLPILPSLYLVLSYYLHLVANLLCSKYDSRSLATRE